MLLASNVLGSTVLASTFSSSAPIGVIVIGEGACGANLNCPVSSGNAWDEIIEGTLTFGDAMRIILAVSAGKTIVSGTMAASSIAFRNTLDDKTRVLADVNGDGERTSVSLDPTP